MDKNDKTLRDRLLSIEANDSLSGKILKQSLLESEGRLGPRKRIENGILALVGGMFLFLYCLGLCQHYQYDTVGNMLRTTFIAGTILSLAWTMVTGWMTVRGTCNEQWHPPLKTTGIVGTLSVSAAMFWFIMVVPRAMAESTRGETTNVTTLVTVVILGIITMVCIAAVLAVYWRVCRDGARMREKMVETQCMIAELGEKMNGKKL
jgi:hypothetical protein